MGLYNSQLGQAKLEKEQVEKDIEVYSRKKKVAAELLEDPGTMSTDYLNNCIRGLEEEVSRIIDRVRELRSGTNLQSGPAKLKPEHQQLLDNIARQRAVCGQLETKVQLLKAEIDDSNYFIEALKKKKDALEHSNTTRDFFDSLTMDLCPVCLSELPPAEPGHCPVCNAPVDNSKGRTQAIRIQLELDFQIRESENLLKGSQEEYEELKEKLRTQKRRLTAAQKQYDRAVHNVRTSREEEIDRLLQDKGYKEAEANQYRTLLEFAEKYERYSREIS